ncbi:MAG: flavin-containing monooxygenase, partial [Actinomycetota bacterium]
MATERHEVVVVGGGQAGLAMSRHLGAIGVDHVVLERNRVAERWRTGRWDSLVANGPAWHDRFPDLQFSGCDPDGFPGKEEIADYFVAYAEQNGSPVRCGVEVTEVRRLDGRPGFLVHTSAGDIEADYVVAATGPFQKPVVPALVPADSGVLQMHSNEYRNPQQLPAGAVLVVGAGSSGAQIAEELVQSGRTTYLSVGAHGRP